MATLSGDGKAIMTIFIGAIITVVFIGSFADNIFEQTNTITNFNESVTGSAVNVSLDLTGRELVGTGIATNATSGVLIPDAIISDQISLTTGLVSVVLTLNDTAEDYVGNPVNVSYTFNPDGYVNDTGGRSITRLILIISALAIVVFIVVTLFKTGALSKLLKM